MKRGRAFLAAGAAVTVAIGPAAADTLYVPPDAPLWAQAGAIALLYGHIGGGAVGLVSGTTALFTRKGEWLHRMAGNAFFISMLIMAGVGATVAPFMPQPDRVTSVAGFLTFYLVATSWMTVARPEGTAGKIETWSLFAALAICAAAAYLWVVASNSPTGTVDKQPKEALFLFGIVAPIAALGDLKVVLRRGVTGRQRIARHLWRMCTALFIAAGSLFLGQPQVFPEPLRGSLLLVGISVSPLFLMAFWLLVVRLTKRFRSEAVHA
jgi:hypothetical protein